METRAMPNLSISFATSGPNAEANSSWFSDGISHTLSSFFGLRLGINRRDRDLAPTPQEVCPESWRWHRRAYLTHTSAVEVAINLPRQHRQQRSPQAIIVSLSIRCRRRQKRCSPGSKRSSATAANLPWTWPAMPYLLPTGPVACQSNDRQSPY